MERSYLTAPTLLRLHQSLWYVDSTVDTTSASTDFWILKLTSIVQAGEFFGALLAGTIIDFSGRKGGFLAAAAFVTLGVILQLAVAGSVPLLGVGRAVLGMGVGIISNAVPLYLSYVYPSLQKRLRVLTNRFLVPQRDSTRCHPWSSCQLLAVSLVPTS